MNNIRIKHITLFILLAMGLSAFGQTTPQEVKIVNERIEKSGNSVTVSFEFDVNEVAVRTNDRVIYTPVIVSAHNKADYIKLPAVVLAGKKRHKILQRQQRLDKKVSVATETMIVLKKKHRSHQSIQYQTTVAYSAWMEGATLAVKTAVFGCADCYKQSEDVFVAGNIMSEKVLPKFALAYIVPDVEVVKTRADRHTATFNYVVDRFALLHDYKDNRSKFDEVANIINEITSNKDIEITEFNIAGYASPEGSASHNKILAEQRAKSFATYLMTKYKMTEDKFTVVSFGEDWNGLRKAVEASTIADKAEVLRIIDTENNPDARDEPLIKLSNGQTYRTLLDEFYPPLRRTEYTIAYTVRSFDVEEAKAIIKINPKLLNLNEMYMVAHSYGAGSPEFNEVFDIAVRMYPDSEIAIMNSAAVDIENNAIDRAIQQMQKLHDNPKAWNNLGVAYALKGDLQKAMEFFSKAATANNTDAVRNLEDLKKYIKGKG